jgi:uncharacterized protein YecT (DUF1311 family)
VRLLGATLLVLAVASPVMGAPRADPVEARYTPAYDKCLAAPDGQSTAGMITCTGQETDRQNAKLNAAYRAAMAKLNGRQKVKLQAAERAWIAFREAQCASLEDEDWGTASSLNASGWFLHMTVQRTIDLEGYPPN